MVHVKKMRILNRKAGHVVYNFTKLLMKIMYKIFRAFIYNSHEADSYFCQVALHGWVKLRSPLYAINSARVAKFPLCSIFRDRLLLH